MKKSKLDWLFVFYLALFAAAPVLWMVQSHFEAQAYNRATGSNVSMWDAMWIELRVQAGPR